MVTITYVPLGPQYGAMQSLHYVQDNAVWLNMISLSGGEHWNLSKTLGGYGIQTPLQICDLVNRCQVLLRR